MCTEPLSCRAMELSSHTTQPELGALYRLVTRREMLRSTPLNLGMFLRYAVLFVLFPGMVGGFRVGLGLTLVFCVALAGLLFSGHQPWAIEALRVWLTAGVCVLAWVSWGTTRAAIACCRKRNTPRPADSAAASPTPKENTLHWHAEPDSRQWAAELVHYAPAAGIYALALHVQGAERCRLLTPEQRGVCMMQSSAQGSNLQTLLLYRMDKGQHKLRFYLTPRTHTTPQGQATWICSPQFPQMLQK